jgi:hypothetical protein
MKTLKIERQDFVNYIHFPNLHDLILGCRTMQDLDIVLDF